MSSHNIAFYGKYMYAKYAKLSSNAHLICFREYQIFSNLTIKIAEYVFN